MVSNSYQAVIYFHSRNNTDNPPADSEDGASDTSSDVPDWPEELPPPPQRPSDPPTTLDPSDADAHCAQKQKKNFKRSLIDTVTHRQQPLYDNCRLFAQNGTSLMAMISRKRMKWYLKKGIAEQLGPDSIRITFEPKGPGGFELAITEKENICVVCGSADKLFRTYVVPHSYRSLLPPNLAVSQSHDVVLQCRTCFPVWAKASGDMRAALAMEFLAPVNGLVMVLAPEGDQAVNGSETGSVTSGAASPVPSGKFVNASNYLVSARSAAKALLKGRNCIPADRQKSLYERVARFLERDIADVSTQDLEDIVSLSPPSRVESNSRIKSHEEIVVEAFRGQEFELVKRWRRLFIDVCQPRRLPDFWSIDYIAKE